MVGDFVIVLDIDGDPYEVRAEGCKWLILPRSLRNPTTLHFNDITLNLEIVRARTRDS